MISYIKTDEGLSAVINGSAYTITSDNASYNQVVDAIRNNEPEEQIVDLFNAANAIKRWAHGNIEVSEFNELTFNGEQVHNVVVDRIFSFMEEGLPYEPLIAFLRRLLANPSKRAVDELYKFLEHESLPITEDGYFLAYKGVREDYTDCHTGQFRNVPGAEFKMIRNLVDDDARVACSNGFHVGSLEYATSFGPKCVIVKVDPADVVSVPHDSSCQKCRVAKYTVLCDYQGALPKPLHTDTPYEDTLLREDEERALADWMN